MFIHLSAWRKVHVQVTDIIMDIINQDQIMQFYFGL